MEDVQAVSVQSQLRTHAYLYQRLGLAAKPFDRL